MPRPSTEVTIPVLSGSDHPSDLTENPEGKSLRECITAKIGGSWATESMGQELINLKKLIGQRCCSGRTPDEYQVLDLMIVVVCLIEVGQVCLIEVGQVEYLILIWSSARVAPLADEIFQIYQFLSH